VSLSPLNLSNLDYPESGKYRTSKDNFEPIDFFLDVLPVAKKIDLLLGYFSSSSIRVLAEGFALFLYNGGEMRLVTNHFYTTHDKSALIYAENEATDSLGFSIENISRIREALGSHGTHFFNCLAWLISEKRIQFVVIKPKSNGISHYKSGLICDGENKIEFTGSCNFTYSGLVTNQESLQINKSFDNDQAVKTIKEFEVDFEAFFSGKKSDQVDYVDPKELEEVITTNFGGKGIEELLEDEQRIANQKLVDETSGRIARKKKKMSDLIDVALDTPKFPYEAPREYQKEAYKSWISNSKKGIFAMATGTGKTLTSLNCLLEEYRLLGHYRALILVPTIALVQQWEEECKKFNFKNIITASSKSDWTNQLGFHATLNRYKSSSFIVITTYASFVKDKFQSYLGSLPEDLLLIADEAHNVGAPQVIRKMESVKQQRRIGLSATVERKYDEEGSRKLNEFFSDEYPYCYSYSMEKAIRGKPQVLCSYYYHPISVKLTDVELKEYIKITKQLTKFIDGKTGKYQSGKVVEMLLLKRKRVVHKAENKSIAFAKILRDEFSKRKDLKYTLIYVPEGQEPNYFESDEYEESLDDKSLINRYTQIVMDVDDSIFVQQYTAKTINREGVLQQFASGDIDVLCSMKCLDEGVDVPRAELAIFCASTGNPRQFIQRRGRILRQHPDKTLATIYDLVVAPQTFDKASFSAERSLVMSELRRVANFSKLAVNSQDSFERLEHILEYYDINLHTINN
jgi:superfamily II DNA or RNA helicase